MGRDLVLKKIKSAGKRMILCGGITGIIFALFAFVLFVAEVPALAIFVSVMALLMFILAAVGIAKCSNPLSAHCFKTNPKLLEQADELFSDIIYQDKFIIYSNRIIANAKDITQMAAFDEITDISENSVAYNGINTDHVIFLKLPNYELRISVYARKRETIENLEQHMIQHCPQLKEKLLPFSARIE